MIGVFFCSWCTLLRSDPFRCAKGDVCGTVGSGKVDDTIVHSSLEIEDRMILYKFQQVIPDVVPIEATNIGEIVSMLACSESFQVLGMV